MSKTIHANCVNFTDSVLIFFTLTHAAVSQLSDTPMP